MCAELKRVRLSKANKKWYLCAMKVSTISRPGMQFTPEHEWMDVNGTVGFVGISAWKLKGIKEIDDIKWRHFRGQIKKGTLIAEIHAGKTVIPIHAPVNCNYLGQNQQLNGNLNLVLESPQDKGWLFFISPSKFFNNSPLLSAEEYKELVRSQKN